MNIHQVTHRYPPRTGGVESHVHAVSHELADRHMVTVRTADRAGDEPRFEWDGKVKLYRRRSLPPWHLSPMSLMDGRSGLADVVHCHNAHSLHPVLAALAADCERLVFSPHYHGFEGRTKLIFGPYRILIRRALRKADRVIAVSEHERDLLSDDLGVDAEVVPHGLDYSGVGSGRPVETGNDFALFVGRLVPHKNVEAVIDTAVGKGMDLVVVGEGPELPGLVRYADENGGSDTVFFAGRVDDELDEMYAGASVLLNPSSEEAFGMVVGEALARGTPCVVNPESGLSRWLDTDGVVGAAPEEMGAAVDEAVESDVDERPLPSWSEVAGRLEEVYR